MSDADGLPPAVDPAALAQLREDDLLPELTDLFVNDGATRMADLREAAAAGDVEQVKMITHRLRGSAGIFGAVTLMELCRRTEEETPSGPALQAEVDAIIVEYQRTAEALRPN